MPGRMMLAIGAWRGRYGAYTEVSGERPSVLKLNKAEPPRVSKLPSGRFHFQETKFRSGCSFGPNFLSVLCGTVHYFMVLVSHVCSSSLEPSPRLESAVPTLVTQVA